MRNAHIRIGTVRCKVSCACILLVIYKPNVNSYYSVLLQTGGQYFAEEQSHLGVPPLYLNPVEYAQYCYDATWTLAYALNQTINGIVCACVCVCVGGWVGVL